LAIVVPQENAKELEVVQPAEPVGDALKKLSAIQDRRQLAAGLLQQGEITRQAACGGCLLYTSPSPRD